MATRTAARRKTATAVAEDFDREDDKAKSEALENMMKNINARFGKNSLMKLGANPQPMETTPSGCLPLDLALGGGYPKGRIVEIFGPESSGKTTLALHAIAEVQKGKGTAMFIDAEHSFDPIYAKNIGVDVGSILLCQPDSGEMALEVADTAVRSSAVDLIVIDSVSALVPRSELEGEVGVAQVGSQARMMSHGLRKITGNAAKGKCTVIFLNQIRYKVAVMYGNPETTSGGQALKFFASQRIDVRKKEALTAGGETIGFHVRAKVVKNKAAPPHKEAEFDIMFKGDKFGINALGALVDAAEKVKVIERRGSFYYFGDAKLGQGREKAMAEVEGKPELRAQIEAAVREKMARGEYVLEDVTDIDPEDFNDVMPEGLEGHAL